MTVTMTPPPRRGLKRTIVGLLLMLVVAPLTVGTGIWVGMALASHRIDSHPWLQPGGQVLHLADRQSRAILVRDDLADCTVTGPAGEVQLSHPSGAIDVDRYTLSGELYPQIPGDYRIDCTAQVKVITVGAHRQADDAFYLTVIIGILAAGFIFVIGGILLIVGWVKLVQSGRVRRQGRFAPPGNGRPPYARP